MQVVVESWAIFLRSSCKPGLSAAEIYGKREQVGIGLLLRFKKQKPERLSIVIKTGNSSSNDELFTDIIRLRVAKGCLEISLDWFRVS